MFEIIYAAVTAILVLGMFLAIIAIALSVADGWGA